MKRNWSNYELIEHWTIDAQEREMIIQQKEANRPGFALLLKFFQLTGRFPEKRTRFLKLYKSLSLSNWRLRLMPLRNKTGKYWPLNIIELQIGNGTTFLG